MRSSSPVLPVDTMRAVSESEYFKMLDEIQNNVNVARGEVYKIVTIKQKSSITNARKCMLNVMKIGKQMRDTLIAYQKTLPIKKIKQTRRKAS